MRAKNLAWRLTSQFDIEVEKDGCDFDTAMNNVAMAAVKASNAHVQAFMFENNLLAIEDYFGNAKPIKRVMERLLKLYGLQTIAENAGMDPIDTIISLRAKQNSGKKGAGINARESKIGDMNSLSILEPLVVKEQIIKSATETACMILRIDDVIAISGGGSGGPPGMPPM